MNLRSKKNSFILSVVFVYFFCDTNRICATKLSLRKNGSFLKQLPTGGSGIDLGAVKDGIKKTLPVTNEGVSSNRLPATTVPAIAPSSGLNPPSTSSSSSSSSSTGINSVVDTSPPPPPPPPPPPQTSQSSQTAPNPPAEDKASELKTSSSPLVQKTSPIVTPTTKVKNGAQAKLMATVPSDGAPPTTKGLKTGKSVIAINNQVKHIMNTDSNNVNEKIVDNNTHIRPSIHYIYYILVGMTLLIMIIYCWVRKKKADKARYSYRGIPTAGGFYDDDEFNDSNDNSDDWGTGGGGPYSSQIQHNSGGARRRTRSQSSDKDILVDTGDFNDDDFGDDFDDELDLELRS